MIKENYTIVIEDNQEKETVKLNMIFKVLAIITAIYTPINLLAQTLQMNVMLPFQYNDIPINELLQRRFDRLMSYGKFKEEFNE
jgi:Mg2+ and Co2+ transporter CorA